MAQMKEQIKTLKKELNKMEISNLFDTEFKTQVFIKDFIYLFFLERGERREGKKGEKHM